MTPKRFQTDDGEPFPFTVLDDRAGKESRRGMYEMIAADKRARKMPADIFAEVKAKAADGESKFNTGDFRGAFRAFTEILSLLPEPAQQWNAAGWVLVAMGECRFKVGKFDTAVEPFQDAIQCPGSLGNPWLHFRLGQCRYERGEQDRAADELARAYMGGGREVFDGEDPKYFALVERVLQPPAGMDRLP